MSTMHLVSAVVSLLLHHFLASATKVQDCSVESRGRRLTVDVVNCEEPPCVLKKKTNASIVIKFIPDRDVDTLTNRVFARVWGIPLPFIGVDGESSCNNMYLPSGENVGCPLQANIEYLYKNTFEIHSFYPPISPMVHWGLLDYLTGEHVVCFEVLCSIES